MAVFLAAFVVISCALFMFEGVPKAKADDAAIHVTNVDEFLAAIESDVEIFLEPGEYNLTKAKNYGRGGSAFYHWESVFDGYELVITDVQNMTVRGSDPFSVTVCTEPRHANVLRFVDCGGIQLIDTTFGHTKDKGACSGGVLLYEYCKDILVESSRMYGCGIRGIDLEQCENVHVNCSDIYECSEGCVYIQGSQNVLFENSKFFNCQLWNGLFEIYSSNQVAVINSEIYRNMGIYPEYGVLVSGNCQGLYMGGLDVHDNQFNYLFDCYNYPVTVEKCRFGYRESDWTTGLMPVNADGEFLTNTDLANMSMRTVQWEPKEDQAPAFMEPGEDGKVHVQTVDEFLAAIANDTVIYLEPGIYDLSTASGYGLRGSMYYYWEEEFDGPELVIKNVSGLTIEGAGADLVTITANPRYANVLRFDGVYGLILRGFKAGHTVEPGYCTGGVLQFNGCGNINIEGCKLYGCGIIGIWANQCTNLYAVGTEIYECSSGAAWFYRCATVRLDGCNVHDIDGMLYYADNGCSDILIDGMTPDQYM